ncbi:MAG: enoyl-CoA hydratase/isomerase family protein [Pseudomonadales bacterium]|jgi:enoyl-CoA hydratase/carnithine racemase|nr:enoyl-CoA hydratase/isomerase family protein [Pseudomonadales bacterium]MDP6469693.1 enoyl-CoA hydratase/isomerase family protein [Pseudomonadales bacterium]MDP6828934.1 enoyl-CoA hydratase/isomerase family protein [Pseudomonadales bacterium]MDP6972734.1 enoyl-CoA hydratase/isomerase family protein [Pseudomonadales bacterium]|tara:strand:+ start:315 stop:971 length:657 start_codon:yes stop_codon:yes gene_type:complete
MSFSDILDCKRVGDGVALMRLNRPKSRNALSRALRGDIVSCLAKLGEDDDVQAVVLTGNGEVFCAGFDLRELSEGNAHEIFAGAEAYHRDVHSFAKPLIAAVNGPALAGGMDLALMCDVRFGCAATRFGQPQVRMGIPAAFDLVRTALDEGSARYLCLSGDVIDASTAHAMGVVTKLFEDAGQMLEETLAAAASIAGSNGSAAMKARMLERQPTLFGE